MTTCVDGIEGCPFPGHTPGEWIVTTWPNAPLDRGHMVIETSVPQRSGRVVAFVRETLQLPQDEIVPNAAMLAFSIEAAHTLARLTRQRDALRTAAQAVLAEYDRLAPWRSGFPATTLTSLESRCNTLRDAIEEAKP